MLVVWIARHIDPFGVAEHLTYWTFKSLCRLICRIRAQTAARSVESAYIITLYKFFRLLNLVGRKSSHLISLNQRSVSCAHMSLYTYWVHKTSAILCSLNVHRRQAFLAAPNILGACLANASHTILHFTLIMRSFHLLDNCQRSGTVILTAAPNGVNPHACVYVFIFTPNARRSLITDTYPLQISLIEI